METTTDTSKGIRNIIAVYDLAAAGEVTEGLDWYDRAHRIADRLSSQYNVDIELAAGVIAALSPNNRWERNVVDAENVIRAYIAGTDDDVMNVKVCTYGKMKAKAVQILDQGNFTDAADIATILNGQKITAFFWCIMQSEDHVCIDGHAYSIWFGDRLTMKEVPNIGKRLWSNIEEDYVAATDIINERDEWKTPDQDNARLSPYQVQAITWCAWRRLHGVSK